MTERSEAKSLRRQKSSRQIIANFDFGAKLRFALFASLRLAIFCQI
jgi:hypothetical protein